MPPNTRGAAVGGLRPAKKDRLASTIVPLDIDALRRAQAHSWPRLWFTEGRTELGTAWLDGDRLLVAGPDGQFLGGFDWRPPAAGDDAWDAHAVRHARKLIANYDRERRAYRAAA
jgi:hypothetical protein